MNEGNFQKGLNFLKTKLANPGWIALSAGGAALLIMTIGLLSTGFLSLFTIGAAFGIGAGCLVLAGAWFYFARSKKWAIPAWLLCIVLMLASILASSFAQMINETLVQISGPRADYVENAGIYTSTQTGSGSLEFLNGQTLGLIEGRNVKAQQAVLDSLAKDHIEVHTQNFKSLQALYKAVRGQSVRAAILTSADAKIASGVSGADASAAPLEQVFKTTIETGISVPMNESINVAVQPYTVLVSASSDPLSKTSYRSTLNLLIGVNPQTRQIVCAVLPRNTYSELSCDENLGCSPQTMDKLGYAGYHSLEALRTTVQNLTGVNVDFAMRINLDEIRKLIDLEPGLGIDTTRKFAPDEQAGELTPMNSPRVTQYLGVISDFSGSDFDQELNQLRLLVSLIRQSEHYAGIANAKEICEILSKSVASSFSYRQLCELLESGILNPKSVTVQYTSLDGSWQTDYSPALTEHAYVLEPSAQSVQTVHDQIEQVLAGETLQTSGVLYPELPEAAS